jgi:hypothetical protein
MGVDYDGVAGIGYKVHAKEETKEKYVDDEENYGEFYMTEFMEDLRDDNYDYGCMGSSYTIEDTDEYYLFIKNPLTPIDKLEDKKKAMLKYIEDNGLYIEGEFDLHVGLRDW